MGRSQIDADGTGRIASAGPVRPRVANNAPSRMLVRPVYLSPKSGGRVKRSSPAGLGSVKGTPPPRAIQFWRLFLSELPPFHLALPSLHPTGCFNHRGMTNITPKMPGSWKEQMEVLCGNCCSVLFVRYKKHSCQSQSLYRNNSAIPPVVEGTRKPEGLPPIA